MNVAGLGLSRWPAAFRIGGTSGSDTKAAQPWSSHSNSAHTRFSSVGSRYTVEPFEPCSARLSAPVVPNTSRNRSTSSTVVVTNIFTVSSLSRTFRIQRRLPIGGRGFTIEKTPGSGIGRSTHFRRECGRNDLRAQIGHRRSVSGNVMGYGPASGRGPVGDADLVVDVLNMVLGRPGRDEQLARDLSRRPAPGDESEHLELSPAQ